VAIVINRGVEDDLRGTIRRQQSL